MKKKRFILGLIILVAITLGVSARPKLHVHAEDARVITVHIDGEAKTIATNATTVQAVLERLHASIGQHDKTEPALDQPVEGNDFTINVYRARPITVVDGANDYKVMTAERSPRQIAEEAGFTTKQEDQFGFKRSDDPIQGSPGTQMVIKRSKTITFDLYGTASSMNTNENTVVELLQNKNVSLDANDEVNVPLQSRIIDGMTVQIVKVGKSVETAEEPVAFTEQQIQDVNQPTTYKQIKTPGQNGKKLVTYELVTRNGGAPVKTPVKEVITQQAVTQVSVVGAKPLNANVGAEKQSIMVAAGISTGDYTYVDYIVSRESGWRTNASNGSTWGLCQALPGSKMSSAGADWQTNPVTQLKWCTGYAVGRYGSWAGAYAAWMRQHWW